MRGWLTRNAEALGALGAIATAFAALTALVVIPYQVGQADRIQRDQTAREIYREFLNLTVQKPELANADYCTLKDETQRTAYSAYVEYLLYTAEQMVDTSEEWRKPMENYLAEHKTYLCSVALQGKDGEMADLIIELGLVCPPDDPCQ
ncbi:hypothetical protein [Paracoccus lutimaris]|uniref:Uncharacterized protein n=1 Tax=Paracoccus lutimaris TaxID=1490030 RepID=A0A368YGT6_9RHOB|nr:hypothetical protein [Paracoccus lutimaris]RCW79442.1 hypothetical protein DFP89_12526 [Paracoccus lutimaris]